jgi:endonuclease/exonuclease/phosphatase (EEP) superfamily protein YafD
MFIPLLGKLADGYALGLLALSTLHTFWPQGSGPLALSQIFAPYLFLPLVAAIPLAIRRTISFSALLLVLCGIVFGSRFGSTVLSSSTNAPDTAATITALSWNLEIHNEQFDTIMSVLLRSSADVIGLQELTIPQAEAIAQSEELKQRYPYQILEPTRGVRGMGLLSRYPIMEQRITLSPSLIWARLNLGAKEIHVVNGHPSRGRFGLPQLYETSGRDAQIIEIRRLIDQILAQNEALLVLGDFNVTEREPMYQTLTAGLQDSHMLVGKGTGHSWRHPRVSWLPFGLLRIDYILSSRQLLPLASSTDCTPYGSDHCPIRASFAFR